MLDVYFKEDVKRILDTVAIAAARADLDGQTVLDMVATAFGVTVVVETVPSTFRVQFIEGTVERRH